MVREEQTWIRKTQSSILICSFGIAPDQVKTKRSSESVIDMSHMKIDWVWGEKNEHDSIFSFFLHSFCVVILRIKIKSRCHFGGWWIIVRTPFVFCHYSVFHHRLATRLSDSIKRRCKDCLDSHIYTKQLLKIRMSQGQQATSSEREDTRTGVSRILVRFQYLQFSLPSAIRRSTEIWLSSFGWTCLYFTRCNSTGWWSTTTMWNLHWKKRKLGLFRTRLSIRK